MIGWLKSRNDLVLGGKQPDGLGSETLEMPGMVVWQVLITSDGLVLSEKRWEKDGEVRPTEMAAQHDKKNSILGHRNKKVVSSSLPIVFKPPKSSRSGLRPAGAPSHLSLGHGVAAPYPAKKLCQHFRPSFPVRVSLGPLLGWRSLCPV